MEIFLLLTVVVVAISSLFVAATLNRRSKQVTKPLIDDAVTDIASKVDAALKSQHQELQSGLDQGRDLAADRQRENATQLEQTMTRLFSDVRRENEKTREQLGQIADQVKDIVSRLTIIELLTADSAAARTSPGEIPVTEVTDPESP